MRHGAKMKECSSDGCTNIVIKGCVCIRHGAKTNRCSSVGYRRMLKQTNPSKERSVCLARGRSQTMQQ